MKRKITFLMTCLMMMAGLVNAQVTTVKGNVTSSEDNEPVVGASVLVKGTTQGSITDVDGNFVINGVAASQKTLVVSYVGMRTQEVPISKAAHIVMEPDAQMLDDVVVTVAYGAAKKSTLTGAIQSVNSEKIDLRPTSSVAAALEGTTSGIQVYNTYGSPGSSPTIRIRGIGTVNGDSSPLYVIDGVPFEGNIADLNPGDIESMNVLKDAASAALYGNRASNGVILITTKQGKQGKVNFELKANFGTYNRGVKEYEMASADEFMQIEWMNMKNVQMTNGASAADAAAYASANLINDRLYMNIYNKADNALFNTDGTLVGDARILDAYKGDLDWYDQAIRSGFRQEYAVSANAAHDKSSYFFSMSYLDENGYVKNSGFDRLTARAKIDIQPKKWIKAGVNLSGTHQNFDNTNGDSDASYTNAFMYCRNIAPIYPVHAHYVQDHTAMVDGMETTVRRGDYILAGGEKAYDSGQYTVLYNNGEEETFSTRNQYPDRHMIWETELDQDKTVRNTLHTIAYTDIYLPENVTFTVKGDLNLRNTKNNTYNNAIIGDGKGNTGRAKYVAYLYKNYTVQEQLRWNRQFGDHMVDVLLGHENYWYNYNYTYGYKTTQVFAGKTHLSNFTDITSLDGYGNDYRTESYLGRVRYNYKDRYNVEASFRRDGSSRFYKDNRWGNFGSLGANWVISQEEFMKDIAWINSLKLRADWGQVGNDAGTGYQGYMALYGSTQNANKGAYWMTQNAANELKWETGESWGIGIESRLFNRWNLDLEYFDKRNKDLIFDVYLPITAGPVSTSSVSPYVTKNLGTISNHGFELNTDVDVYRTKDWLVNLGFNATYLKNKVVTLPEQNRAEGILSSPYKIVEGKSRYEYFTYTWCGIDQMTGNSMYTFNDNEYYITDNNEESGNIIYGSKTHLDAEGTEVANKLMEEGSYTIINGKPYVNNTSFAKREWHGSALPKLFGSFSGTVSYKGLTLSALLTYSLGGKIMDSNYSSLLGASTSPRAYHKDAINSWNGVPEGMTESSADRLNPNGFAQLNNVNAANSYNNTTSSRFLTSRDYLVIKNINLSYQLPRNWTKAMDLSNVSLIATVENLATFTARQGMDPQQNVSGGQYNYLVTPRVYSFGVNVKF